MKIECQKYLIENNMSTFLFANGPLHAPIHPISLTDFKYVSSMETKFKISEQYMSFSNDDFKIVDMNSNRTAFLVSGKNVSLRQQKFMFDTENNLIWTMKHNLFKIFGTKYIISNSQGKDIFTIKAHHRWFANSGKKLSIDLPIGSIVLESSKQDKISVITLQFGGTILPIARIERTLHSARNVIGNVQDYELTVAANVDIAAIISLVIALDEQGEKDEKSQQTGGGIIKPGHSNPADSHSNMAASSSSINRIRYPRYYQTTGFDT